MTRLPVVTPPSGRDTVEGRIQANNATSRRAGRRTIFPAAVFCGMTAGARGAAPPPLLRRPHGLGREEMT